MGKRTTAIITLSGKMFIVAIDVGDLMTTVGLTFTGEDRTGVRLGDMNPRFQYGQMNKVHFVVEVCLM